jgi:hypothetical protein
MKRRVRERVVGVRGDDAGEDVEAVVGRELIVRLSSAVVAGQAMDSMSRSPVTPDPASFLLFLFPTKRTEKK